MQARIASVAIIPDLTGAGLLQQIQRQCMIGIALCKYFLSH
jgi:hypothetical protein